MSAEPTKTRADEIEELKAQVAALESSLESHEALAASEARYRQIVETTREGICIWDAEDRFSFVNPRFNEMFGYLPGQVLGTHMANGMNQDEREHIGELQRRRREGIAEGGELKTRRLDGQEMWIRFESSPILDADGHYQGTLATVLDITERRLAEDELRKSEVQLRQAQEIAHIGSWEWDLATNVVTRSAELCRIYGVTPEDPLNCETLTYKHIHPDDRERVRAEIDRAIAKRQPVSADYRIVRSDGVRFLHGRGQIVCDEAGKPVRAVGTAQDVTDRKQIEARLVLADRMASIGTGAAGAAHEINNPLTYIVTNLDMVSEEIRELAASTRSPRLRELAELIAEARRGGERIKKIVRGLKTLSRVEEECRVHLDVRQVLDGAIDMASNEIRHRARLVKDYHEVALVDADEGRLVQVFINLLVNAAQAIPEGQVEKNEIRVTTGKNAVGRVLIEVRDTGPGMTREVLSRIFDPFYTTKPVGVGTGLGLSICHGIIHALGGEITVASEPGQGTMFRVLLPPAQLPEVKSEAPSVPSAPVLKSGRILVVDDDAMVGNTIRRVLRGHDVTVLADGREARDLLAKGERFDLILCDLMMPEMTGMELHAELARTTPEQVERMLFVTGGAFTPAAREFLDRVPNERLDKPFDHKNLRALVQRFLK
jgi:PAS domain S-box-containing protein